ncbi:hypothetical protein NRK67_05745 [Fusobacteria bacterium ZRK30]|nr:hypothetical protein NRK67_05745 [Fusobacteria bacterium ZRK30]
MNRRILLLIGVLMFFTLVLCNEDIGQIREQPSVTSTTSESG